MTMNTNIERIGGQDRVTMSYRDQSFLVGDCVDKEMVEFTKKMLDVMLDRYETELVQKAIKIANELTLLENRGN